MARLAAKVMNFSFNEVAIEDELSSLECSVDVNLPDITTFGDTWSEFVNAIPTGKISVNGFADFAAAQGDATIFTAISGGEAAFDFDPTGTSVGASNPHYTGNALVKGYKINCDIGGAVQYSAEFQVNGILTRAVA